MKTLNNKINTYIEDLINSDTLLTKLLELKSNYSANPSDVINNMISLYKDNSDTLDKLKDISFALQGLYSKDRAYAIGDTILITKIKETITDIQNNKSLLENYFKDSYKILMDSINNYNADKNNLNTLLGMVNGDRVKLEYFNNKAFGFLNTIPGELNSQKTVYGYISIINKIINSFSCKYEDLDTNMKKIETKLIKENLTYDNKIEPELIVKLDDVKFNNIFIKQEDHIAILNSYNTNVTNGDINTIYDKLSNEIKELNKLYNNIINCLRSIKPITNKQPILDSYLETINKINAVIIKYDKEEITNVELNDELLLLSINKKNKLNLLIASINAKLDSFIYIDDYINKYDKLLTLFIELVTNSIINKASINDIAREQ